jgi:hypothetical protein
MFEYLNDGGLIELALESEIAFANIDKELMREEAIMLIEAEMSANNKPDNNNSTNKTTSSTKSKLSTGLTNLWETIKKLWNTFLTRVKEIVNKVVVATKVAQKFVIKYEPEIKAYKGSNEKESVNPLIASPEKIGDLARRIDGVTKMVRNIVNMNISNQNDVDKYNNEIKNAERMLNDSTIFVHTGKKVDVTLDSGLGNEAIQFLRSVYPKTTAKVNEMKNYGNSIVTRANRDYQRFLKANSGNTPETNKQFASAHLVISRHFMSILIKSCASFVSIMNQCYVDYYKICKHMASGALKSNKSNEKNQEQQ